MPTVVLRPNESQDQLLRRFRKKVMRSGLMKDIRKRRWHVSKSEQRRIEDKKAARKQRSKMNSDR